MKKKIQKWWKEKKKKRLMLQFVSCPLDYSKQRKILKNLLNYEMTNSEIWLISNGAMSSSILDELYRLILFNEPNENDLFHLIALSGSDLIVERALKKFEKKYGLKKSALFILLESVGRDEVAWKIFDKLEAMGLNERELYHIVRGTRVESVANHCFERLLKSFGVNIIDDTNSNILN